MDLFISVFMVELFHFIFTCHFKSSIKITFNSDIKLFVG